MVSYFSVSVKHLIQDQLSIIELNRFLLVKVTSAHITNSETPWIKIHFIIIIRGPRPPTKGLTLSECTAVQRQLWVESGGECRFWGGPWPSHPERSSQHPRSLQWGPGSRAEVHCVRVGQCRASFQISPTPLPDID